MDGSPPGSPVPGILQARTLERVAISFSNAWKWKVKVKSLSHVWLLATPWTAAYQAPPSMGFSRQEYWSGLPLPSPMSISISQLIPTCTLLSRQSFQLLLSSPTLNLILASLEGLESSGSNQSTCFPTLICWSNTKGPSSQSQLPHPFPLLLSSPKPWLLAFQPPNFSVPTRGLQNDTGDNATICRSVALNIHASIVS